MNREINVPWANKIESIRNGVILYVSPQVFYANEKNLRSRLEAIFDLKERGLSIEIEHDLLSFEVKMIIRTREDNI